ncbi:very low-density lipoprotein receptor-like [Tachysurus vachellii]|uniref:very low-density lipoprotein receptor-like n=1 Tax=Tachysurus vachellii TaxID=175792 RepID=UPI00296AA7C6|nr:very low-density lipoprotein receptor-like [Tachysurus vachellii]
MSKSMTRLHMVLISAGLLYAILLSGVESVQKPEQVCVSSQFSCSDGQCVHHSGRCDHHEDCNDGSDEKNCEENECEVNNGGCSHHCVDEPLGFRCDCPPDMRLVQDTRCEDMDPCLDADVCDQVCVHSNISYTCECRHGYMKSSGTGRCLATGDTAAVVFSSSEGIVWMKPDGSENKKITNTTGTSGALTSHTADNTLYWTNTEHIYRLVLDALDHEPTVMFSGVSGIVGLAVDWINEVLYWTSNSTGAVHAAELNGCEHTPLISGLSFPTAVGMQPVVGFLFWADAGDSPKIERSGLNGQNRKILVTAIIQNPVSITLDVPRGLLYWADSDLNTVSRVAYDGLHRKTVVESNGYLNQPFGLAVFESSLYWTDRLKAAICRADKHNGALLKVTLISGVSSPAGLLIYHRLLQPPVSDTATSPAKSSMLGSDSAYIWILSLIVFSCVLFAALFHYRRSGTFSSSLSQFPGESTMKESQDPLVAAGDPETHADKEIMAPVPV